MEIWERVVITTKKTHVHIPVSLSRSQTARQDLHNVERLQYSDSMDLDVAPTVGVQCARISSKGVGLLN